MARHRTAGAGLGCLGRQTDAVSGAFDLYPGQIFRGRVDTIWKANGSGQYLPSDEIPKFHPVGTGRPRPAGRAART